MPGERKRKGGGEERIHGRSLVPDERRRGVVWRGLPIVTRCHTHVSDAHYP